MRRALLLFVLLAAFTAFIAAPALALFPPTSVPRIGGSCVWANGSVYFVGGRSDAIDVDGAGKDYAIDGGSAGLSIYTAASNTWAAAKYDGTGPLGMDFDGNGKCEFGTPLGDWTQSNHGVAYDDDTDGVKEIFIFVGYGHNGGEIWRYDPNASTRGTWSKKSDNTAWAGFRRGAVAINGSKIYFASGASSTGGMMGSYDIATNTWASGPVGPNHQQCGATVVNNKLYIIGGLNSSSDTNSSSTDIFECDLSGATPTWSNGGAAVASLQVGVVFPGVVAYNGKIYIIGGRKADGTASDAIQKFDPVTKVVTTAGTMPSGSWGLGAAVDPATGMLYFGGGGVGGDNYRPNTISTNWWKTNLTNATLTFTAIPNDPAYLPYEDWVAGHVVSGKVLDSAGHGIYNAIVQIGGNLSQTVAFTDGLGNFAITVQDPGTYEIFADAAGYGSFLSNVTVTAASDNPFGNITLATKNEPVAYNGNFEIAKPGDPTKADGWHTMCEAAAFPDNYWSARVTDQNATAGGTASMYIHSGIPADPPIGPMVWQNGWIATDVNRRIPVDPNYLYTFYFKVRGNNGSYMHWYVSYHRANGTAIDGQNLDLFGWIVPPTKWTTYYVGGFQNDGWNHKPMVRMSPPADAAYAELHIGLNAHPYDNPNKNTSLWVDDVVFDTVPAPIITGKVTDDLGNPVAGAVVGIKASANAAADAINYGLTDVNGDYKVAASSPGTWYVAAWKAEYQVSADTQITASYDPMTVDLQLPVKAKKNLATKTSPVYASAGADSASKVVDGDVWANWDTGTAPTATIAVDLGSTKTVSGVVIHWEYARASDYTVEVTTGDPASTGSTWTPVYTSTNGSGGWFTNYWRYMDPIRFPANTQARGVRINATKHVGAYDNYNIWEFQILGTDDAGYSKKIGDVKGLAVGTVVKLDKPVTVSGANGSTYGPAGTTFWVEDIDRSSGIKVVVPTDGTGAILAGMGWSGEVADLTGTIAKDATTGEIYIAATDVQTWQWAGKEFQPVGMNARALTTDMPTGLYVKTWGTVKSVDTTNYSFTIADGSTKDGAPVEITVVRGANMTAALPEEGQWVSIKGVLTGGNKIYEWPVDGFIRGWLMNGAYTVANPGGDDIAWQSANLTNDFFASAGTELAIEPKLGDTAPNGGKWFAASIDALSNAFNFTQFAFEPVAGQTCVYASVWVKPATDLGEDEGLQAWVGSADGYALIINNSIYASGEFGPFVYIKDNVKKDSVTPDADAISYDSSLQTIALKGGEWNHVMIKVNQIDAGFGIAARFMITDPNDSSKMIPAAMEVSLQKP